MLGYQYSLWLLLRQRHQTQFFVQLQVLDHQVINLCIATSNQMVCCYIGHFDFMNSLAAQEAAGGYLKVYEYEFSNH